MSVDVDMYWLIGTSLTVLTIFLTVAVTLVKHIDKRFDKIEKAQETTDQKTENLRTEVYKEFAQRSEVNAIRHDLAKLFQRVDEMNSVLHELVGYLKKRKEHDT